MRTLLIALILLLTSHLYAQELYTLTEPASNIAKGSIGIRLVNSIMDEVNSKKTNYHFIPGVMVGISKKIHAARQSLF